MKIDPSKLSGDWTYISEGDVPIENGRYLRNFSTRTPILETYLLYDQDYFYEVDKEYDFLSKVTNLRLSQKIKKDSDSYSYYCMQLFSYLLMRPEGFTKKEIPEDV